MLVPSIIFMITAPPPAHKVRVNLPQQSHNPADKSKIEQKRLGLRDGRGDRNPSNNDPISQEVLFAFREMGRKSRTINPSTSWQADDTVPYRTALANNLAAAKRSRIERVSTICPSEQAALARRPGLIGRTVVERNAGALARRFAFWG